MKITRLLIATLLFIGFMIVGTGCISLDLDVETKGTRVELDEDGNLIKNIELEYEERGLVYDGFEIQNQDGVYPFGTILIGDRLQLYMNNEMGFEEVDGKVFPQMDVGVFDSDGELILEAWDTLENDGLVFDGDQRIYSFIDISEEDFKEGEIYQWNTLITDSIDGDELEFMIYFKVGN